MNEAPTPRGLLFDLDGVLYVGKEVIPDANETVASLREHFACRFITNTSTLSLASLQRKINAMGFDIAPEEIISAPQAALRYLEQQP
ncbi:MAG TPA: TIGR01458 family HAD-type hydrolase, partial [Methylophilaceae bacterium]|nr:TIGR01458 family HAD-type hydrolase [Methylophilaceae bacterium]